MTVLVSSCDGSLEGSPIVNAKLALPREVTRAADPSILVLALAPALALTQPYLEKSQQLLIHQSYA